MPDDTSLLRLMEHFWRPREALTSGKGQEAPSLSSLLLNPPAQWYLSWKCQVSLLTHGPTKEGGLLVSLEG